MKTPLEIRSFESSESARLSSTCTHDGEFSARRVGARSALCQCGLDLELRVRAFDACIPKKFWYSSRTDVYHNTEVFDTIIVPYVSQEKLPIALKNGIGLFFKGPNGVGKTMFGCWILMEIIRRRMIMDVYYTTTFALDRDTKRGFDPDKEVAKQLTAKLESLMSRRLVMIDEFGKMQHRSGDSFQRVVIEDWIRYREQEGLTTILASNQSLDSLRLAPEYGGYGETIGSLMDGHYFEVAMEAGDVRPDVGHKAAVLLGFES
jgi:DNA replication protein DnaC